MPVCLHVEHVASFLQHMAIEIPFGSPSQHRIELEEFGPPLDLWLQNAASTHGQPGYSDQGHPDRQQRRQNGHSEQRGEEGKNDANQRIYSTIEI
jgi:hypothetical protein